MYKEEVEDDERDTTDEDDVTNERGRENARRNYSRVVKSKTALARRRRIKN